MDTPWTHFHDMHSGGGQKLEWPHIFIEAPEAEARSVFYAKFGRNPDRVTCTCCGEDYSVSESETLEQATGFERGCRFEDGAYVEGPDSNPDRLFRREWIPLDRYLAEGGGEGFFGGIPKVVRADEITDDERRAEVPEEGYVWAGEE